MQNSIFINDAMQAKPAGIHVNVNEGMKSNKCAISREAKRLWATRSETFSYLCEESVSYGCSGVVNAQIWQFHLAHLNFFYHIRQKIKKSLVFSFFIINFANK